MKNKMKALVKVWSLACGMSLLTLLAYHLIPFFGRIPGDFEINCEHLGVPLVSCALLGALVAGVWAWRNWRTI